LTGWSRVPRRPGFEDAKSDRSQNRRRRGRTKDSICADAAALRTAAARNARPESRPAYFTGCTPVIALSDYESTPCARQGALRRDSRLPLGISRETVRVPFGRGRSANGRIVVSGLGRSSRIVLWVSTDNAAVSKHNRYDMGPAGAVCLTTFTRGWGRTTISEVLRDPRLHMTQSSLASRGSMGPRRTRLRIQH